MGRATVFTATVVLACAGNDADPTAATTGESTTTSGEMTSMLSQTSMQMPSTSTGPLPAGCGAADLDPCASIRLPAERDQSYLRGWSSLEGDRRTIVAANPPVLCGNTMPADCDRCRNYTSVHVYMAKDDVAVG